MKYNQEFLYLSYRFNISVELGSKTETFMGGKGAYMKKFHTIVINDMGASNYYFKVNVSSERLEAKIEELKNNARNWVNNRELAINPITDEEKCLISLGFKKQ